MQIMIEVRKGLAIQRDHIAVVESVEDGKKCRVFPIGKEYGIVVDQRYDVVLDQIHAPEADVIEAARALIDILDHAAPYMNEISEVAAAAKQPYAGPIFKNEIEDLRIALRQAE
jgi:hypothetical protein